MFLHNVTQFLENWIFEGISTGADLTKMVKICIISICAKKYFLAKLFVPLIKESVSPQCYAILENWIFEGISTGADLTKMVNICTILNCAKKLFFGKIICSTHQRKSFSTILGNFWKIIFEGISTGAADLTKMVNICTILNCAKKLFFGKIICSTHQRKSFSTTLGNFWKIEFLKEYQQARTLQKWWKFVLSQFVLRKYFFGKIICSTHQRKCFSTILRNFWKIEFLKEYRQARTLQKWWKFVLS